jgi:hypothetical protein
MRTDLPLDALEMALWQRDVSSGNLVHHSDRGAQYLSIRYTERMDTEPRHVVIYTASGTRPRLVPYRIMHTDHQTALGRDRSSLDKKNDQPRAVAMITQATDNRNHVKDQASGVQLHRDIRLRRQGRNQR